MPQILKNSELYVEIDLPHEGYQFSRFDWTGKIREVRYHDMPITTSELSLGQNNKIHGIGLYNEFDIGGPQDYASTALGSHFHKIGIGSLLKTDKGYDFLHPYEVTPATFDYKSYEDKLIISCIAEEKAVVSYRLQKTIELINNSLSITYELHNRSSTTLSTIEYGHNFLGVNNQDMGSTYELIFPFNIDITQCEENVNPDQAVIIDDKGVSFNSQPSRPFFFSNLSGSRSVPASWHLIDHHSGVNVTETGSFNTHKINLWGSGHVISPELFHRVDIHPGAQSHWTRTYRIWMSNNEK